MQIVHTHVPLSPRIRERTDLSTGSELKPIYVDRRSVRSSERSVTDLAVVPHTIQYNATEVFEVPGKLPEHSSETETRSPGVPLSNVAAAHSHRQHKAVISVCRGLLCNVPRHGTHYNTFHTAHAAAVASATQCIPLPRN